MFSVIAKENVKILKVSKPKLTKAVAERKLALHGQDMSGVAEVCHETVGPILEWLEMSGAAPVGSDANVIQHQIDEHQVLSNNIVTVMKNIKT